MSVHVYDSAHTSGKTQNLVSIDVANCIIGYVNVSLNLANPHFGLDYDRIHFYSLDIRQKNKIDRWERRRELLDVEEFKKKYNKAGVCTATRYYVLTAVYLMNPLRKSTNEPDCSYIRNSKAAKQPCVQKNCKIIYSDHAPNKVKWIYLN